MTFDLIDIWAHMGVLSQLIAATLVVMAIACAGVVTERFISLSRSASSTRRFVGELHPLVDAWRLRDVASLARRHPASALAGVVGDVAARFCEAAEKGLPDRAGELARGEAERSKEALGAELRRGMTLLATVGSIAPFVGLLGTVVGIIGAFQGMAASGAGGIAVIGAGIAEALIETALGLLVAIPAVLLFNALTQRVAQVELLVARATGELLDDLEARGALALAPCSPEPDFRADPEEHSTGELAPHVEPTALLEPPLMALEG